MKTLSKITALAAILVLAGVGGANAATSQADATAKIIAAITLTNSAPLNFGTIAPGAGNSDIRVSTAGGRSLIGGDATLVTDAANVPTAAAFQAVGAGTYAYGITVAKLSDLSCGACGGTDIILYNLAVSQAAGSGTTNFTVGGDIRIAANQTAGDYAGEIEVTVNYQ